MWRGGGDACDPDRVKALALLLAPRREPADEAPKAELKSNTADAIAQGVFGVPTFRVDGKNFWGFDSLPMLRSYLEGDAWFTTDWQTAAARPGLLRRT